MVSIIISYGFLSEIPMDFSGKILQNHPITNAQLPALITTTTAVYKIITSFLPIIFRKT